MITVPTYTASQVRAAERPLLDAGQPLMRRAASALAAIVREQLQEAVPRPRVLVLTGSGDNGGDALYAASSLADVADLDVLLVSARVHAQGLRAALSAGARHIDLAEAVRRAAAEDVGQGYALLLDGILGIGASGDPALRGDARNVVSQLLPAVRGGRLRCIAVDLPSGLHPDTGAADDAVLPAAVTVTFGAVKAGLVTGRGPELSGELVLVDLGLDTGLDRQEAEGEASVSRIVRPGRLHRPGTEVPPPSRS